MKEVLLDLSIETNKLRKELEPLPENLSLSYELRDEAIRLGNAALLSNDKIKDFIKDDIKEICAFYDEQGLFKEADQVFPRLNGFFFRQNYDYDEGWNTILDDYRSGKIKSLKDFVNKRKKLKKKKKKSNGYAIRGDLESIAQELDEVETDLIAGIDLGVSHVPFNPFSSMLTTFPTPELTKENAETIYNYFKRYSETKKEKGTYPQPFDSYCESERTKRYWKELDEDGDAVEDFLNYIKEIKC